MSQEQQERQQALAEVAERLAASARAMMAELQRLFNAFLDFVRERLTAIMEILHEAWIQARRFYLYARLARYLPRWLARRIAMLWPRRWLPEIQIRAA